MAAATKRPLCSCRKKAVWKLVHAGIGCIREYTLTVHTGTHRWICACRYARAARRCFLNALTRGAIMEEDACWLTNFFRGEFDITYIFGKIGRLDWMEESNFRIRCSRRPTYAGEDGGTPRQSIPYSTYYYVDTPYLMLERHYSVLRARSGNRNSKCNYRSP